MISIVDDDASVRVATDRLVRSLGYVAHAFASADEFLRSAEADETSCLIAEGRRLPIIFITAFPDESVRARALKAGAICFLTKPFDGPTLIRHLDEALKTSRKDADK